MGWSLLLVLLLILYMIGMVLWIRYAKMIFEGLLDRGASVVKRQNTFVIHALGVLIGHVGFMLLSFLLISQVNAQYAISQTHIDGFASVGFIGLFILVPILFIVFRKPYLRYVRGIHTYMLGMYILVGVCQLAIVLNTALSVYVVLTY